MSYQAKIFLVNLTPKELVPCKVSHICHCAFNMLPLNVDSLVITVADCLFVTGIKQNLNEFIIEHILLFIILMLYVYQRHNLNSSILHDDNNLQISGYNLCREDHPFSIKRGGVCICNKISLLGVCLAI